MAMSRFKGGLCEKSLTIQEWLTEKISMGQHGAICEYLLKHGKTYGDIITEYPEDLPLPKFCERSLCHQNSMLYIKQLQTSRNKKVDEIQYVTGFVKIAYKLQTTDLQHSYAYVRHSFLLYKGKVFDMTYQSYLEPDCLVEEYFGVAFDHKLMRVPWKFTQERGFSLGIMDFVMKKGNPFIIA